MQCRSGSRCVRWHLAAWRSLLAHAKRGKPSPSTACRITFVHLREVSPLPRGGVPAVTLGADGFSALNILVVSRGRASSARSLAPGTFLERLGFKAFARAGVGSTAERSAAFGLASAAAAASAVGRRFVSTGPVAMGLPPLATIFVSATLSLAGSSGSSGIPPMYARCAVGGTVKVEQAVSANGWRGAGAGASFDPALFRGAVRTS